MTVLKPQEENKSDFFFLFLFVGYSHHNQKKKERMKPATSKIVKIMKTVYIFEK